MAILTEFNWFIRAQQSSDKWVLLPPYLGDSEPANDEGRQRREGHLSTEGDGAARGGRCGQRLWGGELK